MKLFTAVFMFLSFVNPTLAQTTGNTLYNWLRASDPADRLQAYAYISGVLEVEDAWLVSEMFNSFDRKTMKPYPFRASHICFGQEDIKMSQIDDIIQRYLEAHPGESTSEGIRINQDRPPEGLRLRE